MKSKKIFLILIFLFIITDVFAEEKTIKNKEIHNIKYSDGKNIYYLPGARISCFADSVTSIKNNIVKLTKGRIWVTATKRSLLKIVWNKKNIEINGATIDINTTNNLLTVFNGVVYISGKRVNKRETINLTNKNISVIKDLDEWQKKNMNEEIVSVMVEMQGKKEIVEKFNNKLKEIFENNYWTSAKDNPEFLVKINVSENDKTVKGTISHILSEKIIGIIDDKTEEKPIEYFAINTGNNILQVINSFIEDEFYLGKTLVIETTGFDEGTLKAIREVLLKISGVKIIEEKSYYEIKKVFKINYTGNGYDVAEIIKNSNINNKKLNIWHISKNNLKIKIQN